MDERLILNPLVDYSEDFVGDYDPNLISAVDLEAILQEGFDRRDPYAVQHLREGRGNSEASLDDIRDLNRSTKAQNTVKRNKWAVTVFNRWLSQSGIQCTVPLQDMNDSDLNSLLPRFVHEVTRMDGSKYPAGTLVSLIGGLQQTVSDVRLVDFFRGNEFRLITESLDAAMKIATREGRGLQTKTAGVVSTTDEERLWETVLGDDTPKKLLRTLFFLNGLHFALRGGEEHADLTIDQLSVEIRDGKKCLIYREVCSKTNNGGLAGRVKPKEVVHFESTDPSRCHVKLFEDFMTKRPAGAKRFYLQACAKPGRLWFCNRPVGKNTLSKFMAEMCKDAGIEGRITNHWLRATCATRLYQANVDEQLIMERTGHRSLSALRNYKRTSDIQIQHCSSIIDGKQIASITERTGQNITFNFKDCNVTINN